MADSSDVSIENLLQRVVACLRKERISYALIGAWALVGWGQPRATSDVDLLVLIDEQDFARLGERMTQAGLPLDETFSLWNPLLRGLQLRFQFAGFTVDLLRPRDAHDRQIFRRKRRLRLCVYMNAIIGLLLRKISFFKNSKSEDQETSRMPCRSSNNPAKNSIAAISSVGLTESAWRRSFDIYFRYDRGKAENGTYDVR